MDDPNNTTGSEEDILTYTASDEALEAAARIVEVHFPYVAYRVPLSRLPLRHLNLTVCL